MWGSLAVTPDPSVLAGPHVQPPVHAPHLAQVCALHHQLRLGLLVCAPVAGAGVKVAQQREQPLHHLTGGGGGRIRMCQACVQVHFEGILDDRGNMTCLEAVLTQRRSVLLCLHSLLSA
jgi:hypothetical protein